MENNKSFSPEESLQLIQSMINTTKNKFSDNSFYFLFWGWLVFICCIVQFILLKTYNYSYHYIVWLTMPIAGIISVLYGKNQSKKIKVKTFIDSATDYVWMALSIAFVITTFINFSTGNWQNAWSSYILLYAIGTFITGLFLKFKPLIWGGCINFLIALISVKLDFHFQLLAGALAILISYIIPGYLLRASYKKQIK